MGASRQIDLTNEGSIRFFELLSNGLSAITLKAPTALAANLTVTLPSALPGAGAGVLTLSVGGALATVPDGTPGQALTTDGSGVLSFTTISTGANDLQEAYDNGTGAIAESNAKPIAITSAFAATAFTVTATDAIGITGAAAITGAITLTGDVGLTGTLNITDSLALTASGTILQGGTTLDGDLASFGTPGLVVVRNQSTDAGLVNIATGANAAGSQVSLLKTRTAGQNANTTLVDTDEIGSVVAYGAEGTNYVPGAAIKFLVDGAPVTTNIPGRIEFLTTPPLQTALNALAFYKLDEAAGGDSQIDFFSNGPNLDTSGAPVQYATSFGNLGNAWALGSFMGSGGQAHLRRSHAFFDLNGNTRTFACWFYPTSTAGSPPIFGNWQTSGGTPVQYLCWLDGGALKWQIRDSGAADHVASTADPSLNNWHYVVCTYNSSTGDLTVQLDNGSTVTANTGSVIDGTSTIVGLGTRNNNGAVLNGAIANFAMWSTILGATERTQLYNSGMGLEPPFSSVTVPQSRLTIDPVGLLNISADDGADEVVTITASTTGSLLRLDNTLAVGVGFDVKGTGDSWTVDMNGNATFATVTAGTVSGGGLVFTPADSVPVIAAGVVTLTTDAVLWRIEGEGAASDTLDTITMAGVANGQVVVLMAADDTHTITVSDNGNIELNGAAHDLDSNADVIMLMYSSVYGQWVEINFSSNA